MELSVVIPTYNGKKLLESNLHKQLSNIGEIIIVDNASTDDTRKYIASNHNQVTYIRLKKNYGFTKAVNTGVKTAHNDLVLILNNDCLIDHNNLKKLIQFMHQNTQFCATQPIVFRQDSNKIENIGYFINLKNGKAKIITDTKILKPTSQRGEQVQNDLTDQKNIFQKGNVYGLSATCLLIRKDIFLKNGMFDESFHSYLEDVDFFIRLAKKGYRYAPCLNAYVKHKHMATSSKMGSYKELHDLTNWIRIIIKNYPLWFILLHFPTLFFERLRNLSGYLKKATF